MSVVSESTQGHWALTFVRKAVSGLGDNGRFREADPSSAGLVMKGNLSYFQTSKTKKARSVSYGLSQNVGGVDGTRTRDPRRDRPVF